MRLLVRSTLSKSRSKGLPGGRGGRTDLSAPTLSCVLFRIRSKLVELCAHLSRILMQATIRHALKDVRRRSHTPDIVEKHVRCVSSSSRLPRSGRAP